MALLAAAIVLVLLQQWQGCTPAPPAAGESQAITDLLAGASRTAGAVEIRGRVVEAAPTWGSGVRLTVEVEAAGPGALPPRRVGSVADYLPGHTGDLAGHAHDLTIDAAGGQPTDGLVSVSLRETSRRWRTGDRLALRSRLRRVSGFGNFGELDWAAYNARRGVFVTAYAWRDEDVTALPAADGLVDGLRRRFAEACARVGGQGAEILEALVIGDRVGIERPVSEAVRDAGLAHFLAISGSHMALIVVLVVAMVRSAAGLSTSLLERYDVLRAAAVLAALAVVAYGAVSGGGVSVARSVLMALAAMAALWRGRPGDDLRALGGSAIVLAAFMPGVGEEAGFQLSYLAVLALILHARRRREVRRAARLGAEGPPPRALARVLDVTLEAVQVALLCWAVTTPVVAQHFNRVSLVSPLANLLAGPLVSAIVVCGLVALVLLPLGDAAAAWPVALGAWLADRVLDLAAWCASLPGAAAVTPAPGLWLTLALVALVLVLRLPPPRRWLLLPPVAVAVVLIAVGVHDRYRGDRLDAWFASVGQGDAAIVRQPGGRVWVIDQGSPGRGRMVVGPLLRRAWIGRVDVLVASHVQSDHSGALAEILEDFEVGEVWLPDGPCAVEAGRRIVEEAEKRGVPVRFVSNLHEAGDVEVLWPPPGAAACNDNDQSLVLAFEFAGRRLLFTGDIEAAAEASLAASEDLRSDVLKVPHHGSRTSSTAAFLEAVRPSLAVASLGLDNQFRFPANEVVARYEALGVELLRTDRDGAVHLAIDAGGSIRTRTFRSTGR